MTEVAPEIQETQVETPPPTAENAALETTTQTTSNTTAATQTAEGSEQAQYSKEEMLELRNELNALRHMARSQQRELAILQGKAGRLEQQQTQTQTAPREKTVEELLGESEKEGVIEQPAAPTKLSLAEQLHADIQHIAETQGRMLKVIANDLARTPGYEDLGEVCSNENFQSLIEQLAPVVARDQRVDIGTARLMVEHYFWTQKDPYAEMYRYIKDNHPKYQQKTATPASTPPKAGSKPVQTPPPSVAGMGGGNAGSGAWSAKRIDEMPERELHKVPSDIYDLYMRGELK